MKEDAQEALVFQDEMEIHLHRILARMWGPVGQQPEIPAPGKNDKPVVYGGADYKTGKIIYTVDKTKRGQDFLSFLAALVTAYAGRKIRLVCDNGRSHQTKAVLQWQQLHRDQMQVFWLPPYCLSLNLIERLWGASQTHGFGECVVYQHREFGRGFSSRRRHINSPGNKMNFMFDHDGVQKKAARPFMRFYSGV